jgi:uncharacterized DUF497 family protein
MVGFQWDDKKASKNWRVHRVSFEQATTVFDDPYRVTTRDEKDDYGEDRWNTIGMTGQLLLVVVSYTFRSEDGDEVTRIISARPAEPHERREYDDINLH